MRHQSTERLIAQRDKILDVTTRPLRPYEIARLNVIEETLTERGFDLDKYDEEWDAKHREDV